MANYPAARAPVAFWSTAARCAIVLVRDVDRARVLVRFQFRNSDLEGSALGRKVGRYVAGNYFRPVR